MMRKKKIATSMNRTISVFPNTRYYPDCAEMRYKRITVSQLAFLMAAKVMWSRARCNVIYES